MTSQYNNFCLLCLQNINSYFQMVYRYSGPKGSTPRANAYLWVVLPQRMGDLDFRTVQGVYYGLINPSSPTFNFVQFTTALGFGLSK